MYPFDHCSFPLVEYGLNQIRIPSLGVCLEQITHCIDTSISPRRHDFPICRLEQPTMIPNIDPLTITNPPYGPSLDDLSCLQDAPRSIGALGVDGSIKDISIGKVFCTKDFVQQRVPMVEEVPYLLCQHYIIKFLNISKTHSSH